MIEIRGFMNKNINKNKMNTTKTVMNLKNYLSDEAQYHVECFVLIYMLKKLPTNNLKCFGLI